MPVADLSIVSHVIIGRTNVISYPNSSEVFKAFIGRDQYKFLPNKLEEKCKDSLAATKLPVKNNCDTAMKGTASLGVLKFNRSPLTQSVLKRDSNAR